MNAIIRMDQIEEFNRRADQLALLSGSEKLKEALEATPRYVLLVAQAIGSLRDPTFSREQAAALVDIIMTGKGSDDIDPTIHVLLDISAKAREVYQLYADIHNVHATRHDSVPWQDWGMAPQIDTITVQASEPPLCMTCGTKMRPAGSCYVCEGCGSTSGVG